MSELIAGQQRGDLFAAGLDDLVAVFARLASGDLSARGVPTGYDPLDAVIVGINMLAEEVEASRDRLETLVRERTAQLHDTNQLLMLESAERERVDDELRAANGRRIEELERMNNDIIQLTELGNLLQACNDPGEAFAVVSQMAGTLFGGRSGAIYLLQPSLGTFVRKAWWGELPMGEIVIPDECWALRRGRTHVSDGPGTLACRHVAAGQVSSVCVPMAAHGETVGLLFIGSHQPGRPDVARPPTDTDLRLCQVVAEQVSLSVSNLNLRASLRTEALHDPLTGLFNRRFAQEWMQREGARASRAGQPLGVLMADIDSFKAFNDAFGHGAGDHVLLSVAEAMRRSARSEDVVCRYGGEEFLVLLPGVDRSTIAARAEALRASCTTARVDYAGGVLPAVTLSVGAAVFPVDGATPDEALRAADAALYRAKAAGRDRIELSPPPGGQPAG
jgi:diguanylate cyclase (GGDEF)-like protein